MTINISAKENQAEWIRNAPGDGNGGEPAPDPGGGEASKRWVPYRGPQGGEGWRNTITQRVVYGDEPPEATGDVDIDDIGMEDVEDIRISGIPTFEQLEEDIADEGREVEVITDRFGRLEGEVTGSDGDAVTVLDETGREREYAVEDGLVRGDVYAELPTFYASGVAGTEQPLVPEEGEPTDPQLAAEAMRRAAEIDSFYRTGPMREFVEDMRSRGVDEGLLEAVVETAVEEHPALQDYEFDEIMEGGAGASSEAAESAVAKLWVPYEGPRGGEGYKDLETGRIEYSREPPGETAESPAELREALEEAGALDAGGGGGGAMTPGGALSVGLADDAPVFAVEGRPAPPVVAQAGSELTFDVDTGEHHPMYISTEPGGGGYIQALEDGVSVQGSDDNDHATGNGVVTVRLNSGHDKLYYECTHHEGMGGVIHVVGDVRSGGWELAEKADPAEEAAGLLEMLHSAVAGR